MENSKAEFKSFNNKEALGFSHSEHDKNIR
jgi:hypothetical protein